MIALPPLLAGALKVTVMAPAEGDTAAIVGAPGALGPAVPGTVTADEVCEAPNPAAFLALKRHV